MREIERAMPSGGFGSQPGTDVRMGLVVQTRRFGTRFPLPLPLKGSERSLSGAESAVELSGFTQVG